jgi:Domain of unknown function (DUF4157)
MRRRAHDEDQTDPTSTGPPVVQAAARSSGAESPVPSSAPSAVRGRGLDTATALNLQCLAGNAAVARLVDQNRGVDATTVQRVIGTAGDTLAPAVRADMETRFGQDFSNVQIHTDGAAHGIDRSATTAILLHQAGRLHSRCTAVRDLPRRPEQVGGVTPPNFPT